MRYRVAALALLLALPACELLQNTTTTPPSKLGGGTVTPPATGGRTQISLSNVSAKPGQTAQITATLGSGGVRVAGTQNDIGFDPRQVAIARKGNGKPDCSANAGIGKEGTAFSVLYTCTVQVAAQASAGKQPLRLSRVGFSDPAGKALGGGGVDGSVTVAK